jgi:protein-L-isoaspartate(D-aspartate) O-methyltransferase
MMESSHEQFIDEVIRPTGASDEVVEAFAQIDRAEFVPTEGQDADPYADQVINLSGGANISVPSMMALILENLGIKKDNVVLEGGTGTGYNAAVMSGLAQEVHTFERLPTVANLARENMQKLGIENVHVYDGDVLRGIPGNKNGFDRGIITAAAKDDPLSLINGLNPGGKLIVPMVDDFPDANMVTFAKTRDGKLMKSQGWLECTFVPLISDQQGGWSQEEAEEFARSFAKRGQLEDREALGLAIESSWHSYGVTYPQITRYLAGRLAHIAGVEKPLTDDEVEEILGVVSHTLFPSNTLAEEIKHSTSPETPAIET